MLTTFPYKYPASVTALPTITGLHITTQTKNTAYFYDCVLLLCWWTEQVSVEKKRYKEKCLKSSCKMQLWKSLNYQLCHLGGDPEGQITQTVSVPYSPSTL